MTPQLSELIERLEKASGPDRELDLAIGLACLGWEWVEDGFGGEQLDFGSANLVGWSSRSPIPDCIPSPTGSIDDALTLLSEGSEISLTNLYGVARAHVDMSDELGGAYGDHEGGHLALAICIAALKAQQVNQ